ncbi:hypothetical protein GDO81_008052 [Engystomops pustulosus]|uniref:Uncharacterized protein n=1 Tax=Engystomops pustulosus TaxID=76066 RepID=A0AAV7CBT9_ENGPU|nr:hypothetical protein GDO81_008052 [Engystomops pustulosus]
MMTVRGAPPHLLLLLLPGLLVLLCRVTGAADTCEEAHRCDACLANALNCTWLNCTDGLKCSSNVSVANCTPIPSCFAASTPAPTVATSAAVTTNTTSAASTSVTAAITNSSTVPVSPTQSSATSKCFKKKKKKKKT